MAAHCIKALKVDPKIYLAALEAHIGNKLSLGSVFSALWEETQKGLLQMPKIIGSEKLIPLIKLCVSSPTYSISKGKLENWLQEALKEQKLDPEEDPIPIVLRDLLTRLSNFFIVEQRDDIVSIHPLIAAGDRALKRIFEYIGKFMADFLTQHGVSYESKKGQSASTYSTEAVSTSWGSIFLGIYSQPSRRP